MAKTVNDIPSGPTAVVTVGTITKHVPGNQFEKWIRITGDASYPTGGYPLVPSDFGYGYKINRVAIINQWPGAATTGNVWYYNTVTQKLMLIVAATGVELANTSDVHDAFCDVMGYGR